MTKRVLILEDDPLIGLDLQAIVEADGHEVIGEAILTASEEETTLFDAIKSGAQGYLLENLEAEEFFDLRGMVDPQGRP